MKDVQRFKDWVEAWGICPEWLASKCGATSAEVREWIANPKPKVPVPARLRIAELMRADGAIDARQSVVVSLTDEELDLMLDKALEEKTSFAHWPRKALLQAVGPLPSPLPIPLASRSHFSN